MEFETTVTSDSLAVALGAKPADPEVARALAVASALLTEALAAAFRTMPAALVDECVLRVARSVWDARKPQHGGAQLTTVAGESPARTPRDPLAVVGPILGRYVVAL